MMNTVTAPVKKMIVLAVLFVAGLVVTSLPSCKSPEHCDAYQGSTRSVNHHNHR